MYKQKLNPKICLKDGLEDFKSFNFGTQEDLSVVFPPPPPKKKIGQKDLIFRNCSFSTWEKVVTFGIWLSSGNGCNMVSAVYLWVTPLHLQSFTCFTWKLCKLQVWRQASRCPLFRWTMVKLQGCKVMTCVDHLVFLVPKWTLATKSQGLRPQRCRLAAMALQRPARCQGWQVVHGRRAQGSYLFCLGKTHKTNGGNLKILPLRSSNHLQIRLHDILGSKC